MENIVYYQKSRNSQVMRSEIRVNIKMPSYQCGDSHDSLIFVIGTPIHTNVVFYIAKGSSITPQLGQMTKRMLTSVA